MAHTLTLFSVAPKRLVYLDAGALGDAAAVATPINDAVPGPLKEILATGGGSAAAARQTLGLQNAGDAEDHRLKVYQVSEVPGLPAGLSGDVAGGKITLTSTLNGAVAGTAFASGIVVIEINENQIAAGLKSAT